MHITIDMIKRAAASRKPVFSYLMKRAAGLMPRRPSGASMSQKQKHQKQLGAQNKLFGPKHNVPVDPKDMKTVPGKDVPLDHQQKARMQTFGKISSIVHSRLEKAAALPAAAAPSLTNALLSTLKQNPTVAPLAALTGAGALGGALTADDSTLGGMVGGAALGLGAGALGGAGALSLARNRIAKNNPDLWNALAAKMQTQQGKNYASAADEILSRTSTSKPERAALMGLGGAAALGGLGAAGLGGMIGGELGG